LVSYVICVCFVYHFFLVFFFFFQAEDGIRDKLVTGVQTCALPISRWGLLRCPHVAAGRRRTLRWRAPSPWCCWSTRRKPVTWHAVDGPASGKRTRCSARARASVKSTPTRRWRPPLR